MLISCFLLVFGMTQSFAADIVYNDIDKMVEIATENSKTIKLYDEKIDIAIRKMNDAEHRADDVPAEHYTMSSATRIENGKTEKLYPLQQKNAVAKLKRDKAEEILALKLQVEEMAYNIAMKQTAIDDKKISLELVKKEFAQKESQLKVGQITETALTTAKNTVALTEFSLKKLNNELLTLKMDFNSKLNLDLKSGFRISLKPLEVNTYENSKVTDLVAELTPTKNAIISKEEALAEKIKDKWIVHAYRKASDDSYDDSIRDMEKGIAVDEVALENAKRDVEYKVIADYRAIENAKDSITMAALDLELAKRMYEIEQVRYDLGVTTFTSLEAKREDLSNKILAHQNAVLAHHVKVEKFKDYISIK